MDEFDALPEEIVKPKRRDLNKQKVFDVYDKRRRIQIPIDVAIATIKTKPIKEGDQWVIREDGREYRNTTKRKVIRDWFTTHGYHVVGE